MKIYFVRNLGQRFKNAKRMSMISKSQDKLKHGLKILSTKRDLNLESVLIKHEWLKFFD